MEPALTSREAAAPSRRRSSSQWALVLALLVIYILSNVDRNVIALLVSPIRGELQISDTAMSYLIGGGFAIFYVTAAVPLGVLADRLNRIRLTIAGIIVWSAATAACGLAQSYTSLFIARVFVGVGEAVLTPCAMSIIADALPREKLGRAISLYAAGAPIGIGVALVAGGSIISTVQGGTIWLPIVGDLAPWRAIFVLLLLPGVVLALVLALFREPARRQPAETAETRPGFAEAIRFLRKSPGVLVTLAGYAVVSMTAQGTLPWLPSFFERTYDVAAQTVSFPLGLIAATCGIVGLLLGGAIGDAMFKRGKHDAHLWAGMVASLLLAPLTIAMTFAPTVELALLCVALVVLVAQVPPGVATAAVQMATPGHLRGVVASLTLVVIGLAAIAVGPSLIAWINDYVMGDERALRHSIAVVSLLAPFGAFLFHIARRPYRAGMAQILAGGIEEAKTGPLPDRIALKP